VQFCMAVLHDIVYHSTLLKTSEVWWAAFFNTLALMGIPKQIGPVERIPLYY